MNRGKSCIAVVRAVADDRWFGTSTIREKAMDPTYLTFFRFFGLRENPFNVNPDPNYLFLNQRTVNALNDLSNAIEARKGLMVVTGDVGTGKTTLLNALIQRLKQQKTPSAFIFNPHLQVSELFDLMLASFAIPASGRVNGSKLLLLNQWLLDRFRSGSNAVLIIDEAQGLPLHVLEEIRMFLNQETPHEKLLQIVLCGQPELEDKLNRTDLRLIRQRISLRCKMTALTHDESHGYIQKRLRTAGAGNVPIFSAQAVDAVYLYSRGIPRVMNLLCEHALIEAYLEQVRPVGPSTIADVARQLQLDDVKPAGGQVASLFEELAIGKQSRGNADVPEVRGLAATAAASASASAFGGPSVALVEEQPVQGFAGAKERAVVAPGGDLAQHPRDWQLPAQPLILPISARSSQPADAGMAAEQIASRSGRASQRQWKKQNPGISWQDIGSRVTAGWSQIQSAVPSYLRRFPQLQSVPAVFSRCVCNAQRQMASLEWQGSWESLLRWLRQPMFPAKEQRRIRH